MPRISGPNLVYHVATQKANVVAATRALVAERGVAAVSLADIAHQVGLGRTAIYRYFPTKHHILMAWFDEEMDDLVEAATSALEAEAAPAKALQRWLDVQLDFLTDSEHRALSDAAATAGGMPAEVAAHFGQRHRELYATLDSVLAAATSQEALRRHRIMLIAGLIRSSAESLDRGYPERDARTELHRGALAIAGF